MTDVIIFGVAGNRQNIERILDDSVNICGYSDIGPHFENAELKEYEHKPFIPMQKLSEYKFDYIVVCCESGRGYKLCEQILIENGISPEKILPTWVLNFRESVFQNTYLEYLELDRRYETVVLGASNTRFGLLTDLLGADCFKFSLNGMDLHGIELYISHLLKESPYFAATKTVILDFAYLMFNLDNCSTKDGLNLIRRMAIYEPFDDLGRYSENAESNIRIKQYKALKKLFAHKYEKTVTAKSNNYMSTDVSGASNDVYANGAWTKIYPETIKENTERFERIMQMLSTMEARVIVLLFPLNSRFIETNRFILAKLKKMFYKRLDSFRDKYEFSVIDFNESESFPSYYYYDYTHMNFCGALKMTQILRERLSGKTISEDACDLNYSVKLLNWGWTKPEKCGHVCGISGDYDGVSGLIINNSEEFSVNYRVHSLRSGWSDTVSQGTAVEFEKEPINAINIYIDFGPPNIHIRYKTYILGHGWTQWSIDGQESGDANKGIVIAAIAIEIVSD